MTRAPLSVGEPPAIDVAFLGACDVFGAAVERVPPRAWDGPSTCAGWTVRDVVGHVVESVTKVAALVRDEPFSRVATPAEVAGDDPVATWRAASGTAREAISSADLGRPRQTPHGRPGTVADALAFPVADLVVHAWDVAHSVGDRIRVPDELIAHVVHTAGSVPEDVLRNPDLFGPPQPVADDADDTTRLVAWLGRDTRPPAEQL